MSEIIVLESSDEEGDDPRLKKLSTPLSSSTVTSTPPIPRKISFPHSKNNIANSSNHSSRVQLPAKRANNETAEKASDRPIKRLQPTLVSSTVDKATWNSKEKEFGRDSPVIIIPDSESIDLDSEKFQINSPTPSTSSGINGKSKEAETLSEVSSKPSTPTGDASEKVLTPIEPEFEALIQACRTADGSSDMEKLIQTKLIKYYQTVHPDFVKSKNFRKIVTAVTEEIKATPDLVYYKVKTVVEELKIRRKSKAIVMSNEDVTTTGNKKRDEQIKKLNKALFILTRRIAKLEEEDVDLSDENSAFLQVERFKKRACDIYEKICDLTGESKHAHRSVKKPIVFNGTCYPQFNRTIQAFVNRTNTFPDYFDVLRCLEHCNRQYAFGMKNDEIKKIAQDAFIKIGKLLQNRRKTDLYETVAHFTMNSADPAVSDPSLSAKLSDNQKFHTKISTIIDKYAREQEIAVENDKKAKALANSSSPGDDIEAEELNGDDAREKAAIVAENSNNNNKESIKNHEADPKTVGEATAVKSNGILAEPLADDGLAKLPSLKILSVTSLNKNIISSLSKETPPIERKTSSTSCSAEVKAKNATEGGRVTEEIVISDEEDS